MPTTAQAARFDLDTLRRAVHDGDVEAMLALYADDAEIVVFDLNNPPSDPTTIEGRSRIGAMLADVFSRDMAHEVRHAITDGACAAYDIACRYGDGTRVVAHSMVEPRGGRIAHEEMIQVWDA
ncbi:MAG TPA: nuclear transport factor 2 family protein [Capillimicrobium sp.]|nr:nuclear transport factor 2 family protein [Capillimicrobium sp.]